MEHGGISNHCLIWTMSSACACVGQYKQVNSCLGDAEILERFFSVQFFGGCVFQLGIWSVWNCHSQPHGQYFGSSQYTCPYERRIWMHWECRLSLWDGVVLAFTMHTGNHRLLSDSLQQEDGRTAKKLQNVFRIVTWKLCSPWSMQRAQVLTGAGMEPVSSMKCYAWVVAETWTALSRQCQR